MSIRSISCLFTITSTKSGKNTILMKAVTWNCLDSWIFGLNLTFGTVASYFQEYIYLLKKMKSESQKQKIFKCSKIKISHFFTFLANNKQWYFQLDVKKHSQKFLKWFWVKKRFFHFGEFWDFSDKIYSRIVNKELTYLTLKRNTFEWLIQKSLC